VSGSILPGALWCAAAACGAGYAGLFLLTRRPAAIRLRRVGVALLVVLALRLALMAVGYSVETAREAVLGGVALAGAAALCLGPRAWLVRAGYEELREQVRAGCRGLFLRHEEPSPNDFLLTAKEGTWPLRLRRLGGRLQFVIVPCPGGGGKVALFVHWLSKQYPGPVPRVRITLPRSNP
jgi:hypothetical protein